ncbi:MAG: pepsin/retropepsin-like aspartic protease family protein [Acidimicrobiales bacterium]
MNAPHPRSVRRVLALIATAALVAAAVVVARGRSEDLLPPPLPPRAPRGELSVRVLRGPHHAALLVARVRIDGKGPYPFLVDTGAAISVVNAPLAAELHLPVVQRRSGRLQGAGCTSSSGEDRMVRWRVGNVGLPAIDVSTVHLSPSTASSSVQGLLGSDLWDRFGSLSIDYHRGVVRLGVVPAGKSVGVRVVTTGGEVVVLAPVDVGGKGPYPFVVDTGASESVVSQDLARTHHLRRIEGPVTVAAVGCTSKASMVEVTHWRSGTIPLPSGVALSLPHPLGGRSGDQVGILGSNELSRFGTATIDYAGSRLVFSGGT